MTSFYPCTAQTLHHSISVKANKTSIRRRVRKSKNLVRQSRRKALVVPKSRRQRKEVQLPQTQRKWQKVNLQLRQRKRSSPQMRRQTISFSPMLRTSPRAQRPDLQVAVGVRVLSRSLISHQQRRRWDRPRPTGCPLDRFQYLQERHRRPQERRDAALPLS